MYFVKASALVSELTILCQHQILRNKKKLWRGDSNKSRIRGLKKKDLLVMAC